MSSELIGQLKDLSISSEMVRERAATAIVAAASEPRRRPLHPRGVRLVAATCLALVCLVLAASFTAPGQSVAEAVGEALGLASPDTPEQADEYSRQVDRMFEDVIVRAQAGDLNADVDPEEVIRVMEIALNPSTDPQTAAHQEKQVTSMLEKLRAAGDIPPSGEASSYPAPASP